MSPHDFDPNVAPVELVWASGPGGSHWAFVPGALPPEVTIDRELALAVSDADRALGELAGVGRQVANPQILIQPFIRREAVLSSRIEGNEISIRPHFLKMCLTEFQSSEN